MKYDVVMVSGDMIYVQSFIYTYIHTYIYGSSIH
jgi:hypothetical protein